MLKYIIKRILLSILILFGVSLITYTLMRMLPMDFVETKFSSQLQNTPGAREHLDELKKVYGLTDSIFVGYFKWLFNVVQGNLGYSFKFEQPVSTVINRYMWVSFYISLIAIILQFLIAIPLGIRAAVKQYSVFDYATTVITMLGISLPSFFFAAILIKVFAFDLGWFESGGGLLSNLPQGTSGIVIFFNQVWHLILPIATVVILGIGSLMRYTRTNTLEVLNADYIRTARAKGLSEHRVIYRHAFRNTLIPLVTMLAGILPGLFGGSMILETVFALPGIGAKAYEALQMGDIPFVMGYNMFLAVLTVVGILLADLMYAVVDPRVKLGK